MNIRLFFRISNLLLFLQLFLFSASSQQHLVILHTNDLHSQMEPIKNGKDKNNGGLLRIAAAIEDIRSENQNVLLFDAGDFWQSTSYFNLFYGKADVDMMNCMKYDAVTLGNHQFDLGIDTLIDRLKTANFEILLANFDVSETPLKDYVKPYTIINKGDFKIGVIGVCVNLEGLIDKNNRINIIYKDPIPIVNQLADMLKNQKKCDVVIVLSHLGYDQKNIVDDIMMAEASENVDIILGGHTHTNPDKVSDANNKNGKKVLIRQMQKSGIYLGRIDLKK